MIDYDDNKTLYMGIDPGKAGCFAVLDGDGRIVEVFDMPILPNARGKDEVHSNAVDDFLGKYAKETILCAFEAVHGMPGDGARSAFSFGVSVGKVKSLVESWDVPMVEPSPQEWKSVILKGTTKDKEAAIGYALHRWPGVNLKRGGARAVKLSDDRAEALCLAEFSLRLSKTET